jgi:hypothetical protein
MEVVLTDCLSEILVGNHTGSFKGLRRHLLSLLGDDVNDEGEGITGSLLAPDVVDPDLRVGYTAVVTRFWVRFASAEPVASSWSPAHL